MQNSGLVSVSFRQSSVDEIISLVKESNLSLIEWGGDVHVPVGDIENAKIVGEKTRNANLQIAAFGSYFKVGVNKLDEINRVIDTAKALGTNVIRIWGGNKNSFEFTQDEYNHLVAECKEICDIALEKGVTLTLECHNNTVTDDYKASLKFLADVKRENLKMYWQPNQFRSEEYNIEAAKALSPYTVNVHVFHWIGNEKLPLKDGEDIWRKYFEIFKEYNCGFLLEFMHDGKTETLKETATVLNNLLK